MFARTEMHESLDRVDIKGTALEIFTQNTDGWLRSEDMKNSIADPTFSDC